MLLLRRPGCVQRTRLKRAGILFHEFKVRIMQPHLTLFFQNVFWECEKHRQDAAPRKGPACIFIIPLLILLQPDVISQHERICDSLFINSAQ